MHESYHTDEHISDLTQKMTLYIARDSWICGRCNVSEQRGSAHISLIMNEVYICIYISHSLWIMHCISHFIQMMRNKTHAHVCHESFSWGLQSSWMDAFIDSRASSLSLLCVYSRGGLFCRRGIVHVRRHPQITPGIFICKHLRESSLSFLCVICTHWCAASRFIYIYIHIYIYI